MQSIADKIAEIEEEIRKTPYHKGTEHHIGKLKARIAKLKEELHEEIFKKSGGGGGYAVKKSGDATVVLVGPPSVGKSTLLNILTNAQSKVGDYDFTTLEVIPGMMEFNKAKIQILDIPGIIEGAARGKGKGKQVLSVARNADLILIVVDVTTAYLIEKIKKELYEFGIRLGEAKPQVEIVKKMSGGIRVNAATRLSLGEETIKGLAAEFRLSNAEIIINEDVTEEKLIDCFLGNRVYLPYLVAINKIDLGVRSNFQNSFREDWIGISAIENKNIEELKKKIWEKLELKRIYLKKGETFDYEKPLVVKKYLSLKEILELLGLENKELIKRAKIYGSSAKFPGQEVSLSFVPEDETSVWFL